jgi:hypothetical protein
MKLFTGFTLFVAATSALKSGGHREHGKLNFFSHARIKKYGIEDSFLGDEVQNFQGGKGNHGKGPPGKGPPGKGPPGKGKLKEKLEGLSEEEREAAKAKFMAGKKDRFQAMKEKFMKLSDEDKEELIGAEMLEKLKALKESMEDMSDEEREAKKAEIREIIKAKFESL